MAKNPDEAKTEGYQQGLEGNGLTSLSQGWTDDAEALAARKQGHEEGKRERLRIEAENKGTK